MGGFRFAPGARYRMPVLFGPTVGPRQGPQGQTYDLTNAPFTQTSVRFLSEGAALDALLPERFALDGDPVVTVELRDICLSPTWPALLLLEPLRLVGCWWSSKWLGTGTSRVASTSMNVLVNSPKRP